MPTKKLREPLSETQLRNLTADEFARLKLTDEEKARLRAINEARAQERETQALELRQEEEPIVRDLHAVGYDVASVWDLVNTSARYAKAVPVLLKHLRLPYSEATREGIARALAVDEPAVQSAYVELVEQYRDAPFGAGRGRAKGGLACALAAAATETTLPHLAALVLDRQQGPSRVLLLSALRKSKSALAKQTLRTAESDPELRKEIASWRRKV